MKTFKWETKLASERMHINYADSFKYKYILVVLVSYTKWIEAQMVSNATRKSITKDVCDIWLTSRFRLWIM